MIDAVLREVAAIGDFFDLHIDAPPPGRRLIELADTAVLDERVAATTAVLCERAGLDRGHVPRRVVVSLISLGLAARVVSPLLAAAAIAGVVPDATPETLRLLDDGDGRMLVALPDPVGQPAEALPAVVDAMVPLVDAMASGGGLAPRLVWGNVASAVVAAGRMVAACRPDARVEAARLAHVVLAHPRLVDAGHFERDPSMLDGYRRASCCLYYQLPNGGLCGDCVFTRTDVREEHR